MSIEKRVAPISEETRYAIKRKSAYALPSNPSERGMSAEEIKKAFYAPVTETAASVLSELDRVVAETNEVFEEAQGDRADKLAEAKQYTDEREAAVRSYADAENAKQDDVTAQLAQELGQTQGEVGEHGERLNTVEHTLSDTVLPGMDSLEERKAEKISPTTAGELVHTGSARITGPTVLSDTTVEGTLSNVRLDTAYGEIEQSKLDILQLRAELSGKGRIFSLPDFSSLINFLQYGGKDTAQIFLMENGTAVYYTASDLKTGDVIYIKEVNVPDVWWIATDSEEGAYSYTYNGIDHVLIGRSEYGGSVIGQAQPLETDYMVIEQHATSASLSAQQAASRASEAATSAGQAAGYAAEAKEEKEGAKTWAEVAEQAAAEAKGFAETAATHVLAAEEQSALSAEAAERATAEADRAQSIVEASNEHVRRELEPRVDRNTKRITNLEQGLTPDPFLIDSSVAYVKDVPTNALPYAEVTKVGGMSYQSKNLFDTFSYTENEAGATIEEGRISGAVTWKKCITYSLDLEIGKSYVLSFYVDIATGDNLVIYWNATSNLAELKPQTGVKAITIIPTQAPMKLMLATGTNEKTATFSMEQIMLNEGDTALPYEPYFEGIRNAIVTEIKTIETTLQIPETIRVLDGYGCGVNSTCYNFVEWGEHGNVVFNKLTSSTVKLCGNSDEDWQKNNGWGQREMNYFAIRLDVNTLGTGVQKALVSSPWIFKSGGFEEYHVGSNYGWFTFYTSAITTVEEWRAYLQENPVELVFALTTAETVDISDLITLDNLIEVEAGGTVTMVNEYGLPVPSEITYMLKEESE